MLVTFAGLAALFVALDGAAGVHPQSPLLAAPPGRHAAERTRIATTATPAGGRAVAPSPSGAPGRTNARPETLTVTVGAGLTGGTPTTPATGTAPLHSTPVVTLTASPTVTGAATPMAGAATTTVAAPPAITPTAVTGAVTPTDTVTPTGILTATGTLTATGDTPPHYGALLNYTNNTQFTPALMQSLAEQIIALTNAQRAAHGLAPLTESGQLDIIAASRSQDQIKRNYFDHYDPTGPVDAGGRHAAAVVELLGRNGVPYTEVGENLINHIGLPLDMTTPRELVDSWMRHREHRDNILHGGYTTIGVGMAAENEADGLHVVFTQVFVH